MKLTFLNKISTTLLLTAIILIILILRMPEQAINMPDFPKNIQYDKKNKILNYSTLTLEQKIAQMQIVYDIGYNVEYYQNMVIGGVHFGHKKSLSEFQRIIKIYQDKTAIPFLTTADMEGCINNPFEEFLIVPAPNKIDTPEEAWRIGFLEGKLLKGIGISMNFAPVVDTVDNIWGCRSFNGTSEEIGNKAVALIEGLKSAGIYASAKHYPGSTLIGEDPHKQIIWTNITQDDIIPFDSCIQANVSSIMISHQIVKGEIDSEEKPSVASIKLIKELKEKFDGLIIADDITMLGVKNYYKNNKEMIADLYKAGNDLIINFNNDAFEIYEQILYVAEEVRKGNLDESQIDESVKKILKLKGIKLVY